MEQHTLKFYRSDQHELLNVTAYKPCKDDLSWYYDLDFLDNYHDQNISPNVTDTRNSGENIADANTTNQNIKTTMIDEITIYCL